MRRWHGFYVGLIARRMAYSRNYEDEMSVIRSHDENIITEEENIRKIWGELFNRPTLTNEEIRICLLLSYILTCR